MDVGNILVFNCPVNEFRDGSMSGAARVQELKAVELAASDDFGRSISYLIGAISNILSIGGSRLYRRAYNIGLTEWRLMWILAIAPRITAQRASQIMGVDKAAISRALAGLERRQLVRVAPEPSDSRQRIIELSESGAQLHSQIIIIAKERERRLLAPFTKDEVRILARLLRRMHANAVNVNAFDPRTFVDPAPSRPRLRPPNRARRASHRRVI
jgi:DNA-binding MarR family transcriptional regulator